MGEIASPSQLRLSFMRAALFTVPLTVLLGIGSGRLSGSGYGDPWFDALAKPAMMPGAGTFALAWATLYALLGLALAIILHARRARGRRRAIALFVAQLAMNLAWSPLFFVAHQVGLAFWLVLATFVVSAIATVLFASIRIAAGVLMLPYLGWLMFAAVLNYQIDRLNPDAETLAPGTTSTQIAL